VATTYNTRLCALSSFYKYAMRMQWLPCNPIDMVERRPRQDYAHVRPLLYVEVKEKLRQIDRSKLMGLRDYAILSCALQTGRRVGEIAAMRCGHLEVQGERLHVVFPRCKGGKEMHDLLPPAATKAVLTWLRTYYGCDLSELEPDKPVWVGLAHNKPREYRLSSRAMQVMCGRRLGTTKFHSLRHTFAHAMEDLGAKLSEIGARLGHNNLAVTSIYLLALRSAENPHGEQLGTLLGIE